MDTTASDLGEAQRDTILAQIKHQIDACKAKQKKSTSELLKHLWNFAQI